MSQQMSNDEMPNSGSDNVLAEAMTLMIGMHGKRAHPCFCTGEMCHVERDHLSTVIAPQHRALPRISDRESPHGWIEMRNPHSAIPSRR